MTIVDLAAVGSRLKALRARLSLTQYEVAYEINVPPRTFQSWETGESETSGANYDLLASYYSEKLGEDITRDQILFGRGIPALGKTESGTELHQAMERVRSDLEEYFGDQVTGLRETLRAELKTELEHWHDDLQRDDAADADRRVA